MAGSNPLYLSSSSCLRCSSLSFYSKTSVVSLRAFPKTPLRLTFPRIVAFSSNDIKVGSNVEVDGAPWRVLAWKRSAAFVRTKMRNYVTGNTVEKTFRAGSTLTEANILKETKQYTYKDGSHLHMKKVSLNDADIGDKKKWLKEGLDCNLLFWNGKRDTTALNAENTELKIRLQSMEQQAQLQDALNEALKQEVQRLKVATGQVNSSSETFNSFGHSLDYNTSFFTLVPQKGPTINPPHPITLPNSSNSSNHKLHPPSKNVSGATQQDQLDQFEGLDIGNGNVLHIVKSESSSISASGSSNTF